MTTDMTKGRTLPLLLRFSLPLLATNLFQQLYNMVDAAIVGQSLGATALGAVGATSSVQFLILGFCLGVCVGFGIPVAQRFGAGDLSGMRRDMFHGIVLALVIAVIMTAATTLSTNGILALLRTPADIYRLTYTYIFIIFLGIPFSVAYNLMAGFLRAIGDSRTPFLIIAVSSGLNIALDFFMILVLHLGVAGAAIATIVSQAFSAVVCYLVIRLKFEILHLRPQEGDTHWSGAVAKKMLRMGIPTGLQFSITAIGSMVMQSANNGLGTLYVSGFAAGCKIKALMMCPFDAIATAAATFAGQNYGAAKYDRIRDGIRQGCFLGVLYGIGAGLVMIFFGREMSMLFVPAADRDVLKMSAQYIRCMGYLFWTLGILNVFRQSVQGLGYAFLSVFSGIVEMAARTIVAILIVPGIGYDAICWTDQAAWASAAVYISVIMCLVLHRVERELAARRVMPAPEQNR